MEAMVSTAAKSSAARRENARGGWLTSSSDFGSDEVVDAIDAFGSIEASEECRPIPAAATAVSATALITQEGTIRAASSGSMTASTPISCTKVATLANRAADTPTCNDEPSRYRPAIVAVVAVAETNPPANPVTKAPRLGPTARTAMYPIHETVTKATTASQIRWGLSAADGPNERSGRTGSTTKAITANLNASASSSVLRTSRTILWIRCLAISSTVTMIASANARRACSQASAPSRKVDSIASAVVAPGSSESAGLTSTTRRTTTATVPAATTAIVNEAESAPHRPTSAKVRAPARCS